MFVLIASLLIQAQAQDLKTLVCFDGKEKLIDMPVKEATVVSDKETKAKTSNGEEFTILNLKCKLKK